MNVSDLADVQVISRAALHFADHIAANESPNVRLAAALAVQATQLSHSNLELTCVSELFNLEHHNVALPKIDEWLDELRASAIVDVPLAGRLPLHDSGHAPLVLRGTKLFLRRFDDDERSIADFVTDQQRSKLANRADIAPALVNLLPPSPLDPANLPLHAATSIASQALSILTGGPGTGKTHTIARLLAAIVQTDPMVDIALAAPTGKAAMRLKHAILASTVDVPANVTDRLADATPVTVHRLLGLRPGNPPRHTGRSPLPYDVVVVDEVSMVSLPLMADLVRAVASDTQLVLVGDPWQLASVEAGSVLRDLVDQSSPTAQQVHELTVNHRSVPELQALFQATNDGDADQVIEILRSGTHERVSWVELSAQASRHECIERTTPLLRDVLTPHGDRLIAAAQSADGDARIDALSDVKLLCSTHNGVVGVRHWTLRIEAELRPSPQRHIEWYDGRPVMVTRNDYVTGLLNGDTGVCCGDDVVFPGVGTFGIEQLSQIETWWAMTVHKSQGSEFRHAVVALDEGARTNTRELFYTALTRAREQLTVVASEQTIRDTLARRAIRSSGLLHKLNEHR